jgi:hypothetical protein
LQPDFKTVKSKSKSNPQPAPSALQTVGALGRELARLAKQLEDTAKEIARTDEVSRRVALEKLNAQRSATFARLAKQALTAEKELGLLLQKSDVDQTWARMLLEFRKGLEQMGRRIATGNLFHGLDPVDVQEVVRSEADQLLAAFAGPSAKSGPFWKPTKLTR